MRNKTSKGIPPTTDTSSISRKVNSLLDLPNEEEHEGHCISIWLVDKESGITALAYSEQELYFSGDQHGVISIWRLDGKLGNGELLYKEKVHSHKITTLQLLEDNSLISCSTDNTIKHFSVIYNERVCKLSNHHMLQTRGYGGVTDLKLLSNNVMVSIDDKCNFWFWTYSKIKNEFTRVKKLEHAHGANICAILPLPAKYVKSSSIPMISADSDGCLKSWLIDDKAHHELPRIREEAHGKSINALAYLSKNKFLSCSADCAIKCWELLDGGNISLVEKWHGHSSEVLSITVLKNGNVVSSSKNGELFYWQVNHNTGQAQPPIAWRRKLTTEEQKALVPTVTNAFYPVQNGSNLLLCGDDDGNIACWTDGPCTLAQQQNITRLKTDITQHSDTEGTINKKQTTGITKFFLLKKGKREEAEMKRKRKEPEWLATKRRKMGRFRRF